MYIGLQFSAVQGCQKLEMCMSASKKSKLLHLAVANKVQEESMKTFLEGPPKCH